MAVDTRKLKLEILLKVQEYGELQVKRSSDLILGAGMDKINTNALKAKLAEIALALHKLTESED